MLRRIILIGAMLAIPITANAQSFYLGIGAAVLYVADEETLSSIDPMAIRLSSTAAHCYDGVGRRSRQGYSLGEIFKTMMENQDQDPEKQIILQIVRVFRATAPQCAAIWFVYVER